MIAEVSQKTDEMPLAPTRVRQKINRCIKNVKWLKEEDELLTKLMTSNEHHNYSKLAEYFPGKTGQQVAERWDKVLNPKLLKGSWTRQEDEIIIQYVKENGVKNWRNLCTLLPGRIGKQCRERWRNHLDPKINHSAWTEEEDNRLIELHKQYGNHWVQISNLMVNRSDNAIKNRWNSTLKKRSNLDIELIKPPLLEEESLVKDDESPLSTPKFVNLISSPFLIGNQSPSSLLQYQNLRRQSPEVSKSLSLEENRNAFRSLIGNC
ncbi:Myb-like DNA-binding domain containing protein [Histomonas meleagridis]|uniref:Myb-like DNA-binding domain containing protein n=1 Tax=Histomonas meleagridis TaxID=135588 RepID=UPI003559EDC4|nr:Myb-like DNA-binding domain containing protein [Histomonas meleagridis]KAH0799263.1 Myb-like DNA-binding domain containing protein [Histomonas meleagridis]